MFVLGLLGFAVASAGAAPNPVMVSPPGIEDPYAFEESVDENYVYFNDATGLLRVTNAGAVERITPGRAIYLADSAQGVVVRSWESLDPADQGGNDLYLIRPNGESVLLTDGSGTEDIVNLPWSEFVGLTPDRRGILIWAPKGPPDNDLRFGCTIQGSGRCDLLAWRDGTFTVLDYGVPFFDYNGNFYRRWTGYSAAASNDLSTVMAGGEMVNENDLSDGDPAAAKIFPTGKSDDVLLEQHAVVQASLDGERAIVTNVTYGDEYESPSLYEWNGASLKPISSVGKVADFLGASPDLSRVWYLMEAGQAGYSLHFSENGKDRVVAPDVGTGILPDGYVDDDYAKVSDDGKSIGFVSEKRLTADDKETRLDAYVATGDGVRLASPGTKQDVEGWHSQTEAFPKSGERITCDDVDGAKDICVDDGGRPALATAGSDDSSDADLVRLRQSGEVVFFT
ncbi:MAG: hypothetical protein IPK93_06195 [Solirubrobacterales bacterium]|nr:hypothetical protein [Solirubrobacterales bacterium]